MFLKMSGHTRLVFALSAWLALGLSASTWASTNHVKFSRAPYLQLGTPTSMYVVWRTAGPINPVVRFGKSPAQLDQQVSRSDVIIRASLGTNETTILAKWRALRTAANLRLPKLHSAPVGTFQYEAKLTGLTPDTSYYYAVYDGDQRLTPADASYQFTTHPVKGPARPMRFWVVGDGGTGRADQNSVHRAMTEVTAREKRPLDFYLHVGDMAYTAGRDTEFQTHFFESYEPTLRNKVCWPAMGNHEGGTSKGSSGVGPYYDAYVLPTRGEAGGVPSGAEAYYAFDYANAHFICLDSHDLDRTPTGAMARWLKADLEKARADWLIAFWHHPPYSKGTHDSDKEKELVEMRRHIMPILEAAGVDLVLTGHSHIYERSMLMDGAYATNTVAENFILDDGDGDPDGDGSYRKSAGLHPHEGTVQVVAGNAGQSLGRTGTMPVMKKVMVEFGSCLVDIDDDTLTATMINAKGERRDLFRVVKRGEVTPVRLAVPWKPPAWTKPTYEPKIPAAPPVDFSVVIPKNAVWRYLTGAHPKGLDWTRPGFDVQGWPTGTAGFGYGEDNLRTELNNMRNKYSSVYLRREFTIEQADKITELGLMINYDDAFIAYLNGHEVARTGVGRSSGRNAQEIKVRESRGFAYFTLKDSYKYLHDGVNVLAIEGHNVSLDSLDFALDPYLLAEE